MKADTLILGGTIVTMDPARRVINDGAIAVDDGRIVAVDTADTLRDRVVASRTVDATDHVVIPGLIDVHAHAGHALVKSIGMHTGDRWEDICGEVYTQASPPEFWYAEARLAALERLRFGVTTGVSLLGVATRSCAQTIRPMRLPIATVCLRSAPEASWRWDPPARRIRASMPTGKTVSVRPIPSHSNSR
ncbi:imidazolonepropionase-like domain-containing protein [Sulfitobacter aestuariivivens]|uniref:amidohydrolase family protein n=1 Tax=Sulfitobacter aestuariivivens TaxID=2766981 RepID=UPI00361324D0